MTASCRALLVAAPASGQGKTMVTAALARRARDEGLRVRAFKTGPDFIDPTILEAASGAPVHTLDLWMVGEAGCRHLLAAAAREADLILVEGVMGLYDGSPSSADLAALFGMPVLLAIDGSAMAQTFGAVALGLARYRPGLHVHGAIANRVAGARHAQMLAKSLPPELEWLGSLPRDRAYEIPERHLGLVQAGEMNDLDRRIAAAAVALGQSAAFDCIPPTDFPDAEPDAIPRLLDGVRIAVARDAAHSFLYPANLETLRSLGAELRFFSPLADAQPPAADAVWLPGGYPELHAERLSANASMQASLRALHASGTPMLAECGGMMGLFETLKDRDGRLHRMVGALPGGTTMQSRLRALGLQAATLPEGGTLRGHSFHYSRCDTPLEPTVRAVDPNGGPTAEPVYRDRRLTASYVHFYFASDPEATARLFLP